MSWLALCVHDKKRNAGENEVRQNKVKVMLKIRGQSNDQAKGRSKHIKSFFMQYFGIVIMFKAIIKILIET